MAYLDRGNLEAVFLDEPAMQERQLERQFVGELRHAGGGVIACDPLVQPDAAPFLSPQVPPGSYPVELIRARKTNALAVLWLKPRTSLRGGLDWRPALREGQDTATLGADQFFGYGVDAGVGCFMSPAAREAMLARLETLGEEANYYDDVLVGELAGDWCDHLPGGARTSANVLVFTSGHGDGSYPTYIGYDGGEPAVLVTDFLVIEDGDGVSKEDRFLDAYMSALPKEKLDALLAMELAVLAGDVERVRSCLEQGVEPNEIIPPMPSTAILIAIRQGNVKILSLLLGERPLPAIPAQFAVAASGTYLDLAKRLRKPNAEIIALLDRSARRAEPSPGPKPRPGNWLSRLFGRG